MAERGSHHYSFSPFDIKFFCYKFISDKLIIYDNIEYGEASKVLPEERDKNRYA